MWSGDRPISLAYVSPGNQVGDPPFRRDFNVANLLDTWYNYFTCDAANPFAVDVNAISPELYRLGAVNSACTASMIILSNDRINGRLYPVTITGVQAQTLERDVRTADGRQALVNHACRAGIFVTICQHSKPNTVFWLFCWYCWTTK